MNIICLIMGAVFIIISWLNHYNDNMLMYATDLIISQVWIVGSIILSGCRND